MVKNKMSSILVIFLLFAFFITYLNTDVHIFGQGDPGNEASDILLKDSNLKTEIVVSGLDFPY